MYVCASHVNPTTYFNDTVIISIVVLMTASYIVIFSLKLICISYLEKQIRHETVKKLTVKF